MSFLNVLNKENEIILNTPKRKELLKDGPPLNQMKCNLLGRGAYGTVIKAIYKAKPVAVKIMKNPKDINNQVMLNEAHILNWKHPNIVRLLKIESTPNFAIIIMERFNGDCLQIILDTMELSVLHRINIAMDITSGLMYCHKRGLLHMDVKPQNVMISLNKFQRNIVKSSLTQRLYVCKLCDFGSSLKIGNENQCVKGLVKGTLRYMAPEALKEEYLTPAVDVFALGITLWQMKHRYLPYHWLQCNDTVAYQVVKHQLRPNSVHNVVNPNYNNTNMNRFKSTTNEQCLCENMNQQFSPQSIEDLRKILQCNQCELIADSTPNNEQKSLNTITKRIPLKELSNKQHMKKFGVKRDLQNEFAPNENLSLATVLSQSIGHLDVNKTSKLEQLYEELFKSCWHDDYKQRPTAMQLSQRFREIL
ncbi:serine/threonine-protein kinase mos [Musca vetustissima]|uniref:serine/threonine-protein kinase mos n=1 Tax=Musca vetustissima TaxID=27455 RepID=UPI002AB62BEB|nr:serine/threonine-protein kinase mos [Musca vetustissima]